MSMSKFERQKDNRELSSLSIQGSCPPGDFTEEDLAFAAELHALFSPEQEELPPYYVQTLLDTDDQRFDPVEHGFEHKTSARVFRRLKLRRRLFYTHTSPLGALSADIGNVSTRRPMLTLVATFALLMLLTVAFTGASFASGFAILLRGPHGSGVYVTPNYPFGMVQHSSYNRQDEPVSLVSLEAAQQQMLFPIMSPQYMQPGYSLAHTNFYVGLDEQWADGPMLEFEYSLRSAVAAPKGTGKIWVREFKPRANVLQVVQEGASIPIQMDNSGRALAIYVDGQWLPRGKNAPVWISGERSELIYQLNGVVFWIVGDQRDGIAQKQLMQVAQGLGTLPPDKQVRMAGDSLFVAQMDENVPGPFASDILVVFPNDGTSGPYYVDAGAYSQPKNGTHFH